MQRSAQPELVEGRTQFPPPWQNPWPPSSQSTKPHGMTSFGKDLVAAMEEAAAHAQGKGEVARVRTIAVPDVQAIRQSLGLSQQAFADACRIPLATLKGWEQGRRQPDATANAYLSVIASLPREAREVPRAA